MLSRKTPEMLVIAAVLLTLLLGVRAQICNNDDYVISIGDTSYFRISRDDHTCHCDTFVGNFVGPMSPNGTTGGDTSALEAEVAQLKATVQQLLTASNTIGSACGNDTDCVYPLVCSPSTLRCLGSTGVRCTTDMQCAYGYWCSSGVCSPANATCPSIQVDNGYVAYTNNGAVGSVATVACATGYWPVGTVESQVCQADGRWSGSTTACLGYNACALDATTCAPGVCTTTTGPYTCECPSGWVGTGTQSCTLHNALDFGPAAYQTINGGGVNSGYNASFWVVCTIQTGADWKECARKASRYGGMLVPVNTGTGAWRSHRPLSNPQVALIETGQHNDYYQTSAIGTSLLCFACRDMRATRNNDPLNGSVVYQGQRWYYQDLGLLYYDQCSLAASNAGAMMITPATVGINSSLPYHINSIWPWNPTTFSWIIGDTGYGTENVPQGSRSSIHNCMIGYVDN